MKQYKKLGIVALIISITSVSCLKDLDITPIDPKINSSAKVFKDPAAFKEALAKLYACYALSGQQGPAGKPDIQNIDEGFSNYLREYWNCQELSTDEAVIAWNDNTIKDFHWQTWTPNDVFLMAMYSRIFYTIAVCNEFVRTAIDNPNVPEMSKYKAEARFLRAFSYWHAIDLFGNVPFVTEADKPGSFFPKQIQRSDLFNYIEKELLAIENDLGAPRFEYGRADQAAAWSLLAKLYLNAKVYIKTDKNTECITYCNKVIAAGYSLSPNYGYNFLADNNTSPEMIFPIEMDALHTQSYGGMNYVIHAEVGGNMKPADYGIKAVWAGIRVTSAFVNKFPDPTGATDTRAMFFTSGQTLDITDIAQFSNGYAVTKFKNMNQDGTPGANYNLDYVNTDYPVFRLADIYLMYAEAVLRGGNSGDANTALGYVNAIRTRAYGNTTGNITSTDLNLDFILDERARELYWEGSRRTDLIRYGKFSNSTYVWPWKGNVAGGVSTDSHLDIYPIPAADLNANPNLKQNPGY